MAKKSTSQRKKSTSQRKKSTAAKKRPRLAKSTVAARVKALQDSCLGPVELAIVDEMEVLMLRIVDVQQRIEDLDRPPLEAMHVDLEPGGGKDVHSVRFDLELTLARLQAGLTAKHRVLRAEKRARSEADLAALREAAEATVELQKRLGLH